MGELARKPGAPELPMTPGDLLTINPDDGYSWIEKQFPSICAGVFSAGGVSLYNWRLSRPFFAGIHRHFIFGALGYAIADWFFRSRRAQKSEKDALLLHYISLHPDDFPPFERQRYKDVFLAWSPRR